MFGKIIVIVSLIALPFTVSLWYHSHRSAAQHRYDVTLYKSVWIYLKGGLCGMEVLTMPTKVASRSEFHTPLDWDPLANRGSLQLHSYAHGPYTTTWIVFPLWIPNAGLILCFSVPLVRGPTRKWWRHYKGHCITCGYNLIGSKSGRCPECGEHFKAA